MLSHGYTSREVFGTGFLKYFWKFLLVFSFFLVSVEAFAGDVQSSPLPFVQQSLRNRAFECLQSCELCHGAVTWLLPAAFCGMAQHCCPLSAPQYRMSQAMGWVSPAPFVQGVCCCPVPLPRTWCQDQWWCTCVCVLEMKARPSGSEVQGQGAAIPSGGTETAAGHLSKLAVGVPCEAWAGSTREAQRWLGDSTAHGYDGLAELSMCQEPTWTTARKSWHLPRNLCCPSSLGYCPELLLDPLHFPEGEGSWGHSASHTNHGISGNGPMPSLAPSLLLELFRVSSWGFSPPVPMVVAVPLLGCCLGKGRFPCVTRGRLHLSCAVGAWKNVLCQIWGPQSQSSSIS